MQEFNYHSSFAGAGIAFFIPIARDVAPVRVGVNRRLNVGFGHFPNPLPVGLIFAARNHFFDLTGGVAGRFPPRFFYRRQLPPLAAICGSGLR